MLWQSRRFQVSDDEKGHYVHLGYHKWMLMDEVRMEALEAEGLVGVEPTQQQ